METSLVNLFTNGLHRSILQLDVAGTVALGFLALILIVILASAIKIVREYERAVVFRMGRLLGEKGPGVIIILPFIDRARIIDLRLVTLDVPKQNIVTKDNVTVDVDAVVYFRVADSIKSVIKVNDYIIASSLLAQTTLRDVIGQAEFDDLLMKRDDLNKRIQSILDEATDPWGIKVTTVAVKDAALPDAMLRAIAKQAEAERERRSRIIVAEGELQAAQKMSDAAVLYTQNPAALHLRELQTWTEVAREKNLIVLNESGPSDIGSLLGIMKGAKGK